MALIIKSVTMRNFLSCGNVDQTVELNRNGLSLVLGENMDLGGNGSRNGVGKSTILQAISFGLYGQSLTNIKVNNLVNHVNQKNMVVSIEFEKDGHSYQIERGRKPSFFRYIVDSKSVDESTDEAQGESRETQKEIDRLLGMSHALFKHIVALNTYTEPFLSLGASKQRELIEELLGITMLSQKAEALKELIRSTKSAIDNEEFRIRTIKQSNERIRAAVDDIRRKAESWEARRNDSMRELATAIANLEVLDINSELAAHRDLETYNQLITAKNQLARDLAMRNRHISQVGGQLESALKELDRAENHQCPTCGQSVHDAEHQRIRGDLQARLLELNARYVSEQEEIDRCQERMREIDISLSSRSKPTTVYENLEQALDHRNTLDRLFRELERESESINPHEDHSERLVETMQEVSYDDLNKLVSTRDHQEFLLKLLTSKDSFIRKRIIDQNLAYLNMRLGDYLDKLGLPHLVRFMNDLSVEISLNGQDLDFDNLSRGERTRLILGLSWAFRDIFESTAGAINLVFVDELLDSGMDSQGLECSIELLKRMERERNKNIFVISHREELVSRVSNVLTVIKEGGFTSFSWDHSPLS